MASESDRIEGSKKITNIARGVLQQQTSSQPETWREIEHTAQVLLEYEEATKKREENLTRDQRELNAAKSKLIYLEAVAQRTAADLRQGFEAKMLAQKNHLTAELHRLAAERNRLMQALNIQQTRSAAELRAEQRRSAQALHAQRVQAAHLYAWGLQQQRLRDQQFASSNSQSSSSSSSSSSQSRSIAVATPISGSAFGLVVGDNPVTLSTPSVSHLESNQISNVIVPTPVHQLASSQSSNSSSSSTSTSNMRMPRTARIRQSPYSYSEPLASQRARLRRENRTAFSIVGDLREDLDVPGPRHAEPSHDSVRDVAVIAYAAQQSTTPTPETIAQLQTIPDTTLINSGAFEQARTVVNQRARTRLTQISTNKSYLTSSSQDQA